MGFTIAKDSSAIRIGYASGYRDLTSLYLAVRSVRC